MAESFIFERIHIEGRDYGYFSSSTKWPTDRSGITKIYVCWENPNDKNIAERQLVRKVAEASWERHSLIVFSGWRQCTSRNLGIRILIEDTGPMTKGLGNALDRMENGMVLNFDFIQWGQICQEQRTKCIKEIAVHEFGHAIGFSHEQNRSDAPGECFQLRQGTDGDVLLTPYDPSSVMNYCNPEYFNSGILSKFDVLSVQKIYGEPTN